MVNKYCVVCGQEFGSKKIQANGYSLLECDNCSTVYTEVNTISLKLVNKRFYDDTYIRNYTSREKELSGRFLKIIDMVEKHIKGGQLLDIGCGVGFFLKLMSRKARYKWELFGVDTNKKLIEEASKKIKEVNFVNKNLDDARFLEDKFDCITCFDVLEHDVKLNDTLVLIKLILKRRGLLFVQCPNYKSVMRILTGTDWDWLNLPDHIYHFNPDSLTKLLQKHGFSDIRLQTWEPRRDFVQNIKSKIRKSLPKDSFFGLITLLLVVPLNILWFLLRVLESIYPVGGLIFIQATNKKP